MVPFFFEQNMQDVWSLPLSCLLVFILLAGMPVWYIYRQ